jgi:hypothetical protein
VSVGDVGERLLHSAACPVLIVPSGGAAPPFAGCGKVLIESTG